MYCEPPARTTAACCATAARAAAARIAGMSARLTIGTAQFGLRYGIANRHGKVARAQAAAILRVARSAGINSLDTAMSYGDSEECLGAIGITGWRLTTKLPALDVGRSGEIRAWVRDCVKDSLQRLQAERLAAVLLHNPSDLLQPCGPELYGALGELKARGVVGGIGISIYDPAELEELLSRYKLDLIQAPFNVLDRRLESSGWLAQLQRMGVDVHVRSVFLQGLLLMSDSDRPAGFARWAPLWHAWREWLLANGVTAVQACVRFALSRPQIERVIVGVDTAEQLQEILAAAAAQTPEVPDAICSKEVDLLNPTRWPRT